MAKNSTKTSLKNDVPLGDDEVEELVEHMWENIDNLPTYIQEALKDSTQPGREGLVSYALVAGWILGKFDFVISNSWNGGKSGWVSREADVN